MFFDILSISSQMFLDKFPVVNWIFLPNRPTFFMAKIFFSFQICIASIWIAELMCR